MSEPQVFSFDIATAIRNIRPNDGFSVAEIYTELSGSVIF